MEVRWKDAYYFLSPGKIQSVRQDQIYQELEWKTTSAQMNTQKTVSGSENGRNLIIRRKKMAYDRLKELNRVRRYYEGDPLQKRFSALITGETNAGKTFLLRTARFPIHIDSFDPGGTKCLEDLIRKGDVITDTSWEDEDPFNPKAFEEWKKTTEIRMQTKYFDMFGTYCIDSLTTFAQAAMNSQLKSQNRAGEAPQHRRDYNPQKVQIENYIRKLMNLSCDFIVTAHLRENEELLHIDKTTGIEKKEVTYRLYITGQAVITVPLLFDELYVITGKGTPPKREMLTDSLGMYIARSRLSRNGKLDAKEEPDIRKLLKKAGLKWEDKPKLEEGTKEIVK